MMKRQDPRGKAQSLIWHTLTNFFLCLAASLLVISCASTTVTDREQLVFGKLPRPGNILVYDFAASADELPKNSAIYGRPELDTTPQTAEQLKKGKELGGLITTSLVDDIQNLGMVAELAAADAQPQLNDLVIQGYLISAKAGSEGKRVIIGFGDGSSDLKTVVEVFQMTDKGLRELGSGDLNAEGGKTPGMVLGAASFIATHNPLGLVVNTGIQAYDELSGSSKLEGRAKQTAKEISEVLKKRFQEQGWI
jgi:hypothetical protein